MRATSYRPTCVLLGALAVAACGGTEPRDPPEPSATPTPSPSATPTPSPSVPDRPATGPDSGVRVEIPFTPVDLGPVHALEPPPPPPPPVLTATTVVVAGADQTAYLFQALAPVVLVARDARGDPVASATVTVTAPAGARAVVRGDRTSTSGEVTLDLTVGLRPGAYTFRVDIAGAPTATITASALEPPRGTIFSLTQPAHGTTTYGGWPGPGTGVALAHPVGLALDTDGTLLISDQGSCRIYALSPEGELRALAGAGRGRIVSGVWECTTGGNGGSMTNADFRHPAGIALDPVGRRLYVVEAGPRPLGFDLSTFVRRIDLRTGVVTPYLGSANPNPNTNTDWPDYNEPFAPLSRVGLIGVLDPVFGPDGLLYLDNQVAIQRVHDATRTVEWWAGGRVPGRTFAAGEIRYHAGPTGAVYEGFFGGVRWDSTGTPYLAGEVQPSLNRLGIVRGEPGAYTVVLGLGSSTADGALGSDLDIGYSASLTLAFDSRDDLYFADNRGHVIRRLDRATGRVWRVAGDGTAGFDGDHIPALDARIAAPALMLVLPGDHLVFADSGNNTVRIIW